ncbi:hypothetical protein GOQ30_08945 [Flavobacterium sp. TP390]|uniref:Peptidase M56 domain-containing protein n=1 Tax=Flavobacterium profundi TaxID=1774945 RepID=A0A6I4ILL2_9FLAO|nr:hypothetical protein [Flavobacterium profundi]MVO09282.1 hypothetical protein [Flavobacterium profundi]
MILLVVRFFTNKRYKGITIYPFVIVTQEEDGKNAVLLNHERIHIKQQLEMLVLPFFVWYGLEFLVRYFMYRSWKKAYRNISFEKESYANEEDLDYLKKRPFWNWIKYL